MWGYYMFVFLQSLYYIFKDLFKGTDEELWGLLAFIGEFGSCKTTSLVYYILNRPNGYNYYTNFDMVGQTGSIKSWKDIVNVKNRSIIAIDEIQNIYTNRAWGEFPPDVLELLTQVRKRKIKFIYTCQHLDMIDISVRRLTKYVVKCSNIASRYVVNTYYDSSNFDEKNSIALGCIKFCSTDKLRSYFDTDMLIHNDSSFLKSKTKKK
jgi:hypothetical protein